MAIPTDEYEKFFRRKYKYIAGIDEAGRGALAGPVVAAAVILPEDIGDIGINDSKQLKPVTRSKIFDKIIENAITYGIGIYDNEIIDKINILQATQLAMKQAVDKLDIKPDYLIVDGNYFQPFGILHSTIIKGDTKSLSIAAASIIAKVTRDRIMLDYDMLYPEYEFAKHKGYGTKQHYITIEKYGICPIHRRSFLKKLCERKEFVIFN